MQFNFNGKITEWEAAAAQGIGTARAYADAVLKLLTDIRNAVSIDEPEKKRINYRGTVNTTVTGNPSGDQGTIVNAPLSIATVPQGQKYTLKHLMAVNAVQLLLDGRIIVTTNGTLTTMNLDLEVGQGELTINGLADNTAYYIQLEQYTPNKTKINDGFAGREPNAGLMTGGRIDPDRHFDSQRVDVHIDGARR